MHETLGVPVLLVAGTGMPYLLAASCHLQMLPASHKLGNILVMRSMLLGDMRSASYGHIDSPFV
jgi:hypothetical protein